MKAITKLTVTVICGLVLTACGGGGDDGGISGSNSGPGGGTSANSGNTNTGNTATGGSTSTGSTGTSSGNTSSGNTSSGNTSSGNASSGNASSGNTSSGNTSSGNTSSGNTSSGNTSGGNTSGGNASTGSNGGYTVTPSVSGTGGTISPSSAVSVQPGATTTFTLTPNSGYILSAVSGTCSGSYGDNNVYTVSSVTADCTVEATFAPGVTAKGVGPFSLGSGPYKVSQVAGELGYSGSTDGPGATATFNNAAGIALAPDGSLYVADTDNDKIRKIAADGTVSTVVGGRSSSLASDTNGSCANATFYHLSAIVVDANGSIYVADSAGTPGVPGNVGTIRKITNPGTSACAVSPFAGIGGANYYNSNPMSVYTDGTGTQARFGYITGLALDATGNMYVADEGNSVVRKITPNAVVTTFAGNRANPGYADGQGASAKFDNLQAIAVDAQGNAYVTDDYMVRKITSAGMVSTVAGSSGSKTFANSDGSDSISGSGVSFSGLAVDANGNIYVAVAISPAGPSVVHQIAPNGVITTVAGKYNYTTDDPVVATSGSVVYRTLLQNVVGLALANGNLYFLDADGGFNIDMVGKIAP